MPGAGIKPADIRPDPPSARLLDVTRLASRAGRGLTGVDRVERAYLVHLLALDTPVFGLARTVGGYALLDREGLTNFLRRVDGRRDWGRADLFARLARRLTEGQQRADTDLRRLAVAWCTRQGLRWMLRRRLPPGTAYLNIGHSNLTTRVLRSIRSVRDTRISVFIHDTIPLDYPEYQREGTVERFRRTLRRVARNADLLIYNSARTRSDVDRTLARWDMRANGVVAHLGVELAAPDADALPAGLRLDRPYFVVVGTIEPRKNHALLLDVWDLFAKAATSPDDVPVLLICGGRGWRNEDVFARLDALPPDSPVRELADLSDGAMAALVAGASALLQPSFAEGFGLPPAEAATAGTPVVCSDLSVFREVLGDIAVYLSPVDRLAWAKAVQSLMRDGDGQRQPDAAFVPPSWDAHFNTVLRLT